MGWINPGQATVYLFQPRAQPVGAPERDGELLDPGTPLDLERQAAMASPALQPGSAAEWALGELLIRLCNGGKPLRPERPG
jgi:hypothetical protein